MELKRDTIKPLEQRGNGQWEKMETITFSELQESGLLGEMITASGRPIYQVDTEITRQRVGAGEFYYRDPDSKELKRVVL